MTDHYKDMIEHDKAMDEAFNPSRNRNAIEDLGICNPSHVDELIKDLDAVKADKPKNIPCNGDKYMVMITERSTCKTISVDAYDIIIAVGITCPAKAHALKKIMFSGERGAKSYEIDVREAINSLEISLDLYLNRLKHTGV